MKKKRILILGASGMLGSMMFEYLSKYPQYDVIGTIRERTKNKCFNQKLRGKIKLDVDALVLDYVKEIINETTPHVVINCIGVVKQISENVKTSAMFRINSLFPKVISNHCEKLNIRFVHISTDCVFDGKKGMYTEEDDVTANDDYGISKFLGEPNNTASLTIRTSIIGHEKFLKHGLLEWFLSQHKKASGYTRAIFSGLTTLQLAKVFEQNIIPNNQLVGVYHVASDPISKYDLLCIIRDVYKKNIEIFPETQQICDRSLDCTRFKDSTGYSIVEWKRQIIEMYEYQKVVR